MLYFTYFEENEAVPKHSMRQFLEQPQISKKWSSEQISNNEPLRGKRDPFAYDSPFDRMYFAALLTEGGVLFIPPRLQ
jgi:hypothetical protein